MGVQITVDDTGISKALEWTAAFKGQLPYAQSLALNRLAYQVQQDLKGRVPQYLAGRGAPLPYTKNAFYYTKSTKTDLNAQVMAWNPQDGNDRRREYMSRHVFGGARVRKSYEVKAERQASDRSLSGMRLVPTRHMPLDAAGNVPRRFWEGLPEALSNRRIGWFIGRPHPSWPAGIYYRNNKTLTSFMLAKPVANYAERFPMRNISEATIKKYWPGLLNDALIQALGGSR